MRRIVLPFFAVLGLAPAVAAKDPPPDTPAAAFTRTRKLPAKVTVEVKDAKLRDALQAISDQLEDQKLGVLVTRVAAGVPADVTVTYSGKGVTVEAALDAILKAAELGYVVVSKEKDRADGWLDIAKGPMRGYPTGVGPEPKTVAATPPAPAASPEDEKLAQAKLDLAKTLQADNKADRAKVQLKFIVKFYPGTKAAAEAKDLLEKLGS